MAAALLGMTAIMGLTPARAAAFHDSSYVRVEVPDMSQAVTFFQDVLACSLIGPAGHAATTRIDRHASVLFSCGSGSVVELSLTAPSRTPATSHHGTPLPLTTNDVTGATQWLRHQGVQVNGPPRRLASGQLAVNFVTPWGQPLQLVGWPADIAGTGH